MNSEKLEKLKKNIEIQYQISKIHYDDIGTPYCYFIIRIRTQDENKKYSMRFTQDVDCELLMNDYYTDLKENEGESDLYFDDLKKWLERDENGFYGSISDYKLKKIIKYYFDSFYECSCEIDEFIEKLSEVE